MPGLSIERIQAGVARCLLKAEWCTPKPTLLEQLDWPALRWRREISSLTFFHKIIRRQLPPLTDCFFPFAHCVSNRSQRKPLQLLLPQTRSTWFTKSFFYRSALLWNSLPSCIQEILSSTKFRKVKQLKTTGPATNTSPTLTSLYLSHLLSDTSFLLSLLKLCSFRASYNKNLSLAKLVFIFYHSILFVSSIPMRALLHSMSASKKKKRKESPGFFVSAD